MNPTERPTPELLPCPFCGSEASVHEFQKRIAIICVNPNCWAQQKATKELFPQIVAAWNTRRPLERQRDTALDALRETVGALENKMFASDNADETGYVTDAGFLDLEAIDEAARSALTTAKALLSGEKAANLGWSKLLPNEQGLWWWWNEDEDSTPFPVSIMYSGTSDSYFASEGQWGWNTFQEVADMGGWWMKVAEPERPLSGEGGAKGQECPPLCTLPPEGWQCSRQKGHAGPCAATPIL